MYISGDNEESFKETSREWVRQVQIEAQGSISSSKESNIFFHNPRESNPDFLNFIFPSNEVDESKVQCHCLEKRSPNLFQGFPWFGHPTSISIGPSFDPPRPIQFQCFVFVDSSSQDDVTILKDGNVVWKRYRLIKKTI
jgi:hypothetical protein